jgi:hypothetical protein
MNPTALKAALDTMFAAVTVLLAWEEGVEFGASGGAMGLAASQRHSVLAADARGAAL